MADDGVGRTYHWTDFLVPEALSGCASVVEVGNCVPEGIWNNGVVEGVEGNGVVQGMGNQGAELLLGEAGSNSQRSPSGLREQGSVSDGNYSGLEFGVRESSMVVQVPQSTVKVRNKRGAERKAGRAPPGSRTSCRSKEDYSKFASHFLKSVLGVEAPQSMGNLGEKSGVDRMGAAPPGAPWSKRQRSPSGGWIGTSSGSNDEGMGSEFSFSHEAAALANVCTRKRPWAKERKSAWWDRPGYTDADFKRDFHVSRSTFSKLCDMLASSVAKQDTAPRAAIPVPQRVAVCVYRFATGETFYKLAKRFDICSSTCHKILREVTAAINTIVQPGYVSALWPHGADAMNAAAMKFQDLTGGIPGVIGAVYTTHVPIIQPEHHVLKYHSRCLTERHKGKISYSVTIHAAVDADGAFTNLCIGKPGATSDEEIFSLSMSENRTDEMVAQGTRLVGGAGYPLTDWTLVPYTHGDLTPPQNNFNEKVALARGVALDAFRRLKARWAIVRKRVEGKLDLDEFSSVMAACCVLHNLCERTGDELGDELKGYKLEDDEIVLHDPERSAAAAQVRDAIAHNLPNHAGAGGSMPS